MDSGLDDGVARQEADQLGARVEIELPIHPRQVELPVFGLRKSASATSRFLRPSATWRAIWSSCGVSFSGAVSSRRAMVSPVARALRERVPTTAPRPAGRTSRSRRGAARGHRRGGAHAANARRTATASAPAETATSRPPREAPAPLRSARRAHRPAQGNRDSERQQPTPSAAR